MAQSKASKNFLFVDSDGSWPQEYFLSDPYQFHARIARGTKVAIKTNNPKIVIGALSVLENYAAEVHLMPAESNLRLNEDVIFFSDFEDEYYAGEESDEPGSMQTTKWILYTSGTTGVPKPVEHSLKSLTRTISKRESYNDLRWGLLYSANRMAGLQVILQALQSKTTLIAPDATWTMSQKIEFLMRHKVNALSATPTMWRQILQSKSHAGWNLTQITLGGEIADQKILDSLHNEFPLARIVHIFASTETGVAFAVTDGKEGFPEEFLQDPPRGVRIKIIDGILHVELKVAGSDKFVSTEDSVEIDQGRVKFLGRESGQVNIGGAKVWPEQVEAILRSHEYVVDALVAARKNSFTGSILIAQVVPTPDSPKSLDLILRKWMKEDYPNYFVPALIAVVDKLDANPTGKVIRN